MSVILITGSAGLIGSEATQYFAAQGYDVIGIDNNMRSQFFGAEASTEWQRKSLIEKLGARYRHFDLDIRATGTLDALFKKYGSNIKLIVHTAAQPSHDWAARDPHTDFSVNANGTLNLLEATRKYAPDAAFIFTSTNKVYGDTPNRLPLIEQPSRWEIDPAHPYASGIPEDMSIDHTLHSLFGASKVAADVLVQEYGRYFGMKTGVFRGGCLTGPNHSGTQLHGFLAYLMKCAATGTPYKVFGYKGKQVRDNIHSADLIAAFAEFFHSPRSGEVYNMGGGRFSNCSMLEAIQMCEEISGRKMQWSYEEQNRTGDHIWYVSDLGKFQQHYPNWQLRYDVKAILQEIYDAGVGRWGAGKAIGVGANGTNRTNGTYTTYESHQSHSSHHTKKNILGVGIDATDYAHAVERIIASAQNKTPLAVSALAVHGVMTGVLDQVHRHRLNQLDLVVPDGQPVRWALNLLHRAGLQDRVYGPNLMLKVCERAAAEGLPIYLYGSKAETLAQLQQNLRTRFPNLIVAGAQPSRFRQLTAEEKLEVAEQIKASGAAIMFVGLGCPRQEVFAYEFRNVLPMPLLAVGAAFDFHAGTQSQAPEFLQRNGLEWLYRLSHEPRRLWQRYVLLNPLYVTMLAMQALRLKQFNLGDTTPPSQELRVG